MCGLTAAFYPDVIAAPTPQELKNRLEQSCKTIQHRGPDSSGVYVSPDGRVGLGHVRLSIIDLATGQQPLSDEDGVVHCIVNGEIYDHERIRAEMQTQGYTFTTKSDSELVLQLYKRDGFNCLHDLRGEFAFVLYDSTRRLLFAARDRFGIKPLYYTIHDGCIMFASEIKAFMALGWTPEWDIESITQNGEIGDERTAFRGVQKLPAGYFAICHSSGPIKTEAYWDLDYAESNALSGPTESVEEIISTVRKHLVDAVRVRLRSDVPLAAYLSGGIDSSAVVGIAAEILRETDPDAKLTSFTLAYVEDPTTDESPLAEHTAAHTGCHLVKVPATEALLVGVLEDTIWHAEQPLTTFHAPGKALLSKAVADAGFKVVLTGEGSDEIFGGYPWFPLDFLQAGDAAAAGLGIPLPTQEERAAMANAYGAMSCLPHRTKTDMAPEKKNAPRPMITTASHLAVGSLFFASLGAEVFTPAVIARFGVADLGRCVEEGLDARVREKSVTGRWHPLHVSQYVIAKTLLGRTLLSAIGDRADMMNSLESRIAFLDHHLVDYVNKLPPSLKIMPVLDTSCGKPRYQLVEKWLLRQAAKPFISDAVYSRRKVPFNPPPAPENGPEARLLPLQRHLQARLTQTTIEKLGFIRWAYIKEQLDAYLERPAFLPKGAFDPRARMLMWVLGLVVLQERFAVPTYV
ncbi:putative asparagine synthase [Mycena amicta]|nr:putative asparagine synthase [Mycena amicta]